MPKKQNIVIAIDGYSSSGKSTLAKDLAKKLGYKYIDTGAMYRAITFFALENGYIEGNKIKEEQLKKSLKNIKLDFKEIEGKNHILLNGKDIEGKIRTLKISTLTSLISTLPFVREYLVAQQREIAKQGGVVMDGRDIGTVVLPDADIKFFVTAQLEIRAKRRYYELKNNNQQVSLKEVIQSIKERDKQDTTRKISPLKKAPDAIEINNSTLNREQQLELALKYIKEIKKNYEKENK